MKKKKLKKLSEKTIKNAVQVFASIGGRAKSEKKAEASRVNGKKGGRPKKAVPSVSEGVPDGR